MAIDLVTKFAPYTDEKFKAESKTYLLTNQDFDFVGAHVVKVYKISTAEMNDYIRHPVSNYAESRYGVAKDLDAVTETFMMTRDRSFTFVIDKLDVDETSNQLEAAKALSRQLNEVVIPEIDSYTYAVMAAGAGFKPDPVKITSGTIYHMILDASKALDDSEVPESGRQLLVSPEVYQMMKGCPDITMETDVGNDMRLRGVISNLDGANVIKVPSVRLPAGFGFILAHPSATVAPMKLTDYKIHQDPPGISGNLVEGRVVYDAFVLDNKAKAIYYQAQPTE